MRKLSTMFLSLPLLAACSAAGDSGPNVATSNAALHALPDAGPPAEADFSRKFDSDDHADRDRDGAFEHIFYIMMENHATEEIIGNTVDAPFINQLASKYAVAANYYGVTHPSLPNYLAAISGDFQGIWDDCKAGSDVTCAPEEFVPGSGDPTSSLLLTPAQVASASSTPHWFDGKNIVDQLEGHRLDWKAYMQSLPDVGSTVEFAPVDVVDGGSIPRKLYAQKHNPFVYFSDIRNSPSRMDKIVPFSQFDADIDARRIPNFVWISPDQCHDMHGVSPSNAAAVGLPQCGYPDSGLDHGAIALGDAFLKDTVTKIMHSQAWRERSAIVIVWDEDDYAGYAGCCKSPTTDGGILGGARAPAIVLTSGRPHHQIASAPFNHYSLLGTIERLLHLGCLANTCKFDESELMTPLFY